ncbi:MAG: winged helix DNA-binding domain-containing protein, partial [Holosporaceae bacterium]|nr:winged helix DNA-binding domain-containing protein [Holosporaceae bacterium]
HHKDWIIKNEQIKLIWTSAGHVESVILSGTEVIGTWRHSLKGRQMTVQLFPFREITKNELRQIQEKAEELAIFWEKELAAVAQ